MVKASSQKLIGEFNRIQMVGALSSGKRIQGIL
jgi:hypothetical protein